jgi:DsbC/DsbD-like thiol-disulfide interchange protein
MMESVRKLRSEFRLLFALAVRVAVLAICLAPASLLMGQIPPTPANADAWKSAPAGARQIEVSTPHLDMKYYSTRDPIRPNMRFTLVADLALKPKMHVYSPGVQGFIPISLEIDPSPNYTAKPAAYPPPQNLYLEPIQETLAVYQGKFQITQDVTMSSSDTLKDVLSGTREVKIRGHLRYQACDDQLCYIPQNLPLEWVLKVEPLDRERIPEPIQHKATSPKSEPRP